MVVAISYELCDCMMWWLINRSERSAICRYGISYDDIDNEDDDDDNGDDWDVNEDGEIDNEDDEDDKEDDGDDIGDTRPYLFNFLCHNYQGESFIAV